MSAVKPLFCVVSDDAPLRSFVRSVLCSIGFDVQSFDAGSGFLLSGLARRCDGLIIETQMRDMTGLELRQALREAGVLVAVIHLERVHSAEAHPQEACVTLTIPAQDGALLTAVRSALAGPKA